MESKGSEEGEGGKQCNGWWLIHACRSVKKCSWQLSRCVCSAMQEVYRLAPERDCNLKLPTIRKNREGTYWSDFILISFPVFLGYKFPPERVNSTDFWIALHDPCSNQKGSQIPVPEGWHFIWGWKWQRIQRLWLSSGGGTTRACMKLFSHGSRGRLSKQAGSQGGHENVKKQGKMSDKQGLWKTEVFSVIGFSILTSSHTDQMTKI